MPRDDEDADREGGYDPEDSEDIGADLTGGDVDPQGFTDFHGEEYYNEIDEDDLDEEGLEADDTEAGDGIPVNEDGPGESPRVR